METCKLDVWAIQYFPEAVESAIDCIVAADPKGSGKKDVFFEGFDSRLTVGDKEIKTYFDSAYFSSEKGILILLMQGGKLTPGRFRTLLDNRGITDYVSVRSNIIPYNHEESNNKELWFAKEGYVLKDALNESLELGIDTCEYFPNIRGGLVLGFPSDIRIANLPIHGVIVLEDKIVLILDQGIKENIKVEEALKILEEKGITPNIKEDLNLPVEDYKILIKGQ